MGSKSGNLNLQKLDKMSFLALKNALRLHSDAITLYKNKRFASSFAISIISQEEIGKMHMINDFVWNWRVNGSAPDLVNDWINLLYKHPLKQKAFARHSPDNNYSSKSIKLMDEISKGKLEIKKHEALYVGLLKIKGKVAIKGKIQHPFNIKGKVVSDQITKINDYFLVIGIGLINEVYSLDDTPVEKLFTRGLLKSLAKKWPYKSSESKKLIYKIQNATGELIL